MEPDFMIDPIWWISVVELPALGGLFWLLWRTRHDGEQALEAQRRQMEAEIIGLRQCLSDYKLEVAKSYASVGYLADVERRLLAHLLRIENKLDRQGAREGR